MLESFEHRGHWWLPATPDRRVTGTLTFSQASGAQLDLLGTLGDDEPFPGEPRIIGLLDDGRPATAEDCMATNFTFGSGIPNVVYRPGTLLIGAAFAADEELEFAEVAVRFTDLEELVGTSGFNIDLSEKSTQVAYAMPPERVYRISADFQLKATFGWSLTGMAPVTKRVEMAQQTELVLLYEKPVPLKRIHGDVYRLRNFLGLAAGRPVHTQAVTAYLRPESEESDDFTGLKPVKHAVQVFYRLAASPEEELKPLHPYQMLFTLANVDAQLEKLLGNWFEKHESLQPVFDLYFATIYNRGAYLDQKFLTLMQAIETYHRRTSDETDLSPADHAKRMTTIVDSVPEEHRAWVSKRLEYANEIPLRRRLKRIVDSCQLVAKKVTGKPSTFISKAVDTRNYRTHYDPSLKNKAVTGTELHRLVVRLRALIEMCLLLELGFSAQEIDRIFERIRRYEETAL